MKVVGVITQKLIDLLGISDLHVNQEIIFGDSNETHMKNRHYEDFIKYGVHIEAIIAEPDYVYSDGDKGSIEYIKQFYDETNSEYVLVAVRASGSGMLFARTLFIMSDAKVNSYKARGFLRSYT